MNKTIFGLIVENDSFADLSRNLHAQRLAKRRQNSERKKKQKQNYNGGRLDSNQRLTIEGYSRI